MLTRFRTGNTSPTVNFRVAAKASLLVFMVSFGTVAFAAPTTKPVKKQNSAQQSAIAPQRNKGAPRGAPTNLQRKELSLPAGNLSGVQPPSRGPGGQEQLEVLGQVRNLNMMLILHNRSEGISGFELRKHYRGEITTTNF
jgi:hypothetical protein